MADSNSSEASAQAYKLQGNSAYQRGDYRHAIYLFSKGLELNSGPEIEHVLYSNRSACYCLLEDFTRALADADAVIRLKPTWPKGYTRKGAALRGLNMLDEAIVAYTRALELEPDNEVAQKGLQEVENAARLLSKRFVAELTPTTEASLATAKKELEQLKNVRWHFEILKDRIWLADPPLTPFRPRSMFIVDPDRQQLLSMTAHPSRDSISLDQLVEFVVNTFINSGIYPGTLEFSDYMLMSVLAPPLSDFHIKFVCDVLSEDKRKFFDEKIQEFEVKEREQWQDNPKFSGVLRQRLQKGMLSIPGVTPPLLRHLLAAAAAFWRSKAMLYFTRPMGLSVEGGPTKVALVTRNTAGQYSLAQSTIEAARNPLDTGTQSYLFADPSTIPFDDADLIERYGWDIADDKYPLATMHEAEGELHHPTVEDLEWYEVAFQVAVLVIEATFAKPTFVAPPQLCYSCVVHTSKGRQQVVVTVPPLEAPDAPTLQLEASPLPPPKERLSHAAPAPKKGPKAPKPTPKPASKRATPEPKPPGKPSPKPAAKSVHKTPPGPPSPHSHKAKDKAAPQSRAHSPLRHSSPPTASEGVKHGVQVSYHAEVEHCTSLLAPQEDLLALRRKAAEQERLIAQLQTEVKDYREQLAMQRRLGDSQKVHIDRLQEQIMSVEKLNDKLRRDLSKAGTETAACSRQHLLALATQSHDLVKALGLLEVNLDRAQEVAGDWPEPRSPEKNTPRSVTISPRPNINQAASTPSRTPLRPLNNQNTGNSPKAVTPSSPNLSVVSKPPSSPPRPLKRSSSPAPNPRLKGTPMSRASPGRKDRSSPTKSMNEEPNKPRPIPGAAFLTGPWIGRLSELDVLPQDISLDEYMAPPNAVF